jgi:hypothetical protein
MVDLHEAEQLSALARNWLEAEEAGETAAVEAFENELHERITFDGINRVQGLDAATGEPWPAETARLQMSLERMWTNASVRLD